MVNRLPDYKFWDVFDLLTAHGGERANVFVRPKREADMVASSQLIRKRFLRTAVTRLDGKLLFLGFVPDGTQFSLQRRRGHPQNR